MDAVDVELRCVRWDLGQQVESWSLPFPFPRSTDHFGLQKVGRSAYKQKRARSVWREETMARVVRKFKRCETTRATAIVLDWLNAGNRSLALPRS